ncbi:hypothetical protein [Microcoleus sp. FACHB-672]|uniref:hypothetical protein n=1 Tax=Microcoleus sp. FACHB-672 TaxID=2692825 RepID=UPI001683337B|nr:hypothetical protein [Microcoleus sp. FACHB-672]MBD2041109.1 hypothetical protein [Microcoleus sp. FACHB-672]
MTDIKRVFGFTKRWLGNYLAGTRNSNFTIPRFIRQLLSLPIGTRETPYPQPYGTIL